METALKLIFEIYSIDTRKAQKDDALCVNFKVFVPVCSLSKWWAYLFTLKELLHAPKETKLYQSETNIS